MVMITLNRLTLPNVKINFIHSFNNPGRIKKQVIYSGANNSNVNYIN
jgi:hypothetical protein